MAPAERTAPWRFEKGRVVAVGDEADLVAVGLLGDGEAELARERADRRLVERADREQRVRELLLRQREEEIRLILRRIDAALEQVRPAGLAPRRGRSGRSPPGVRRAPRRARRAWRTSDRRCSARTESACGRLAYSRTKFDTTVSSNCRSKLTM